MTVRAVIFAGGGTGGHIFPAIAICEHLQALDSGIHMGFICSNRPIDSRILSTRQLSFHPVDAQPFSLRPRSLGRFVRSWRRVVQSCEQAMARDMQACGASPGQTVLVGTGGFVTVPAFAAARRLGVRTVLVNLDAIPGKANRLLASRADLVFTTYDALGGERVGPIVRREARGLGSVQDARRLLKLDPDVRTLVVTGASQGAGSLNAFVPALVGHNPALFAEWQILHQAGPSRVDEVRAAYEALPVRAQVVELIDEVGAMWTAADLAIARAGAGTVAEAWVNRVPCVFMPYPYHRDEHQRHNAMPLVDAGGAVVLRDLIDPEANTRAHASKMERLLTDLRELSTMREALESLACDDGGLCIAASLRNL